MPDKAISCLSFIVVLLDISESVLFFTMIDGRVCSQFFFLSRQSFNCLCTSVHYKPTDSHTYLLYSSSHPSHVKNSIPFSRFLRLRCLRSDDSNFFHKSESMCQFFEKRGCPVSVVQAGHHRAQLIDRQSSQQTSQKEHSNRIPFTLTFHPHNHSVKSIILKNFKLLQNDLETGTIFFATSTHFIQTQQKPRQFFGQKFIPN